MWSFNGKDIRSHSDLHHDCTDIVYLITYTNGKKYFGKKVVRSVSTLPVLKTKIRPNSKIIVKYVMRNASGKIITSKSGRKHARSIGNKARKEYYETVTTDKKFIAYKGSSELSKELVVKTKEILYQCSNKKAATYIEAALMFEHDVLFTEEYVNENILGSFYNNSLDGLLEIK